MQLQILIDEAALNRTRAALGDMAHKAESAISGAINETLAEKKTSFSRGIRERVNIKKKDIDKYISVARATPKRLRGSITLSEGERIPLKYFGARQTAKGVTYRIAKTGGRTLYKSAFGPKIAALGHQVFTREGPKRIMTKGRYKGQMRQPIVGPRKGPSPWGVFVKAGLRKKEFESAQPIFDKNLNQRVNAIVRGFVRDRKGAA